MRRSLGRGFTSRVPDLRESNEPRPRRRIGFLPPGEERREVPAALVPLMEAFEEWRPRGPLGFSPEYAR